MNSTAVMTTAVFSFVLIGLVAGSGRAVAADAANGEAVFRRSCAACHAADVNSRRPAGHLVGVVGRPAGSLEGVRYSAALRDSGIVWDEETLNRYLADPRDTVRGTTMPIRIADAAQRADLIAYLATLE